MNWWTETTEIGVVSCSIKWFVLGLAVIGMFIKCPVYNKMRSPYAKSADDPKGLWKAVNHPTDQEDDNKSCCSHHHATTAFSLTEMISQLCFISVLSELSYCWWMLKQLVSLPWLKQSLLFVYLYYKLELWFQFGCVYVWDLVPSWGHIRNRMDPDCFTEVTVIGVKELKTFRVRREGVGLVNGFAWDFA